MTKTEAILAFAELDERLRDEMLKGSTGTKGKWADAHARDYLLKKGIGSTDDVRCRKAGQVDVRIKVRGIYKDFEIKTAMSEWKVSSAEWSEADVLPGYDYVIYACESVFLSENNFHKLMWVFTREQFVEMLKATGSKGLQSSLRYNHKHETLGIQPWVTKVTDKKTGKERWAFARLNKFYAYVKANEIPTLEQFKEWAQG